MALCIGIIGCETSKIDVGGRIEPLEGTRWRLVQLFGEPVIDSPDAPFIVLDAKSHRMNGSGGVNGISSRYKLEGGRLTFGPIASTRMSGSPQANQLESDLLEGLGRVQSYRLVGTSLELQNQGKIVALFTAQ